jgi:hypothetical protein
MGYGKGWGKWWLNSAGNSCRKAFSFCSKMEQGRPGNLEKYRQWWHSFLKSLQERSRLFRENVSQKNKP